MLLNVVGLTPNVYLFTGEQWDADLGMYFLRARYLNPETGRFHTMDSYEGRKVDPQTLHKYLYAHAMPTMGTDPSGEKFLADVMSAIRIGAKISARVTVNVMRRGKRLVGHIACASAKTQSRSQAPIHHIATNKHTTNWTSKFEKDIFNKAGVDLNYWANKLRVPGHKGPHTGEYHKAVYDHLKKKIDNVDVTGLATDLAEELILEALTEGLLELADQLCDKRTKLYKLL